MQDITPYQTDHRSAIGCKDALLNHPFHILLAYPLINNWYACIEALERS
jgi:hypothetical protein